MQEQKAKVRSCLKIVRFTSDRRAENVTYEEPVEAKVIRCARWQDRFIAGRTGFEPAKGVTVSGSFLRKVAALVSIL